MITENQNYQPSFRKPSQLVVKKNSEKQESTLLEILISEYGISKRQVEEILKKYEYQYIIQKIKLVKNRKNIKNTGAYLISALHKDYQENEAKKKQVKKIPLENTSVRESKAASEIIPLKNKYMSYKLKAYTGFIEQQADKVQKKIHKKFIEYLKPKSQIYKTYQKKKLTSPFVITEFLIFLENHFSEIIGEYLTFDDYLTSEM
jgi:hypothetical protein